MSTIEQWDIAAKRKPKRSIIGVLVFALVFASFPIGYVWNQSSFFMQRMRDHDLDTAGGFAFMTTYCKLSMPMAMKLALIRYEYRYPQDFRRGYRTAREQLTGEPLAAGLTLMMLCPIARAAIDEATK